MNFAEQFFFCKKMLLKYRLNTNVPESKCFSSYYLILAEFCWAYFLCSRYNKDLFYISPLYGKAFTKLEKIIFIDMDLDFYGECFSEIITFGGEPWPRIKCVSILIYIFLFEKETFSCCGISFLSYMSLRFSTTKNCHKTKGWAFLVLRI